MAEVRLRPRARADIDAIWDYTITTWGVQQARYYVNGLRVYPSGKHLVFYLVMENGIDVVLILHGSMDVRRHL